MTRRSSLVAWRRVRGNKGARTAGVDGQTARSIELQRGAASSWTSCEPISRPARFEPLPVRERMIPKAAGKLRRLGIPTARDRVVQAALKLVLEPIFEADFKPCSYGFRPKRRAQDAIAEIHYSLARRRYEWVLEADIEACFDEIDHSALLDRMRDRVGDKRVLALVKAFLKAGILTEDGSPGTRTPAPRRAASSRRCWPTSPCRCSTSTSPRPGSDGGQPVDTGQRRRHGVMPPTGWSGMRTTSW